MKKLLLILCALFAGIAAEAQCVASLSAVAAPSGNHLLRANFTNSSSYGTPFAGQLKEWRITYGDGTYQSSLYTAPSYHDYPAPGTYSVGIRIHNMDSLTMTSYCTDTTHITVTVGYPPCGTIITATSTSTSGVGPTFNFSATNPAG